MKVRLKKIGIFNSSIFLKDFIEYGPGERQGEVAFLKN